MKNTVLAESKQIHHGASGEFFPTLDGLRALAILSVVIHHFVYFNPATPAGKLMLGMTRAGWMGVPIFFVLSGFLISYTVFKAGDRFSWSSYGARRMAKIIPPFYLSIVVSYFFIGLYGDSHQRLLIALADATTVAHFIPDYDLQTVYWTLYIEIHFYILLPVVYFLVRRVTRFAQEAVFLSFILVAFLDKLLHPAPTFCFPRTQNNFALGILFAIIYLRSSHPLSMSRLAPMLVPAGAVLMICTYLVYGVCEYKYDLVSFPYQLRFEVIGVLPEIATFMLLFSVFLPPGHLIVRILSCAPLVFIGLVSYEWYLFHELARFPELALGNASGSLSVYLLKTLAGPLVTLALSTAIYYGYSAPILAWAKRRFSIKPVPNKG